MSSRRGDESSLCPADSVVDAPLGGLAKRIIDAACAGVMVLLAAPLMLMLVVLIRLCLGGPTIAAQTRIGYRGRGFLHYKFRTVTYDAPGPLERDLAPNPGALRARRATRALVNPWVTALGRTLRGSGLDALPQLFNVLRGDMSLVGPALLAPDEIARYGRHTHLYLGARPGLTGLWQARDRDRPAGLGRIACDRHYLRRWSLWLDLALLLKAIPVIRGIDRRA